MSIYVTVTQNGSTKKLPAAAGQSLYDLLTRHGYALHAPCGGRHTCRKCLVTASGALSQPTEQEASLAAETGKRLACFLTVLGDAAVVLPDKESIQTADTDLFANTTGLIGARPGTCGLSVDIGTTTLALALYDLASGRRLAVHGAVNPQRTHGADVISRITYCMENDDGLARLQRLVLDAINDGIADLCARCGVCREQIVRCAIAANTVMCHLLHGLSPAGLAAVPFTAQSLFGTTVPASQCGLAIWRDAPVHTVQGLASFVGGDVTAGLFAVGAQHAAEPFLFLDVGTNGEIAAGDGQTILCCATAAGPAFEGAEISCGMAGVPGAIARVWAQDGGIAYQTIGGLPPAGLCGSGLIDALALVLDMGLVDESGRLLDADEVPSGYAHLLMQTAEGENAVCIAPNVWLTAGDVRKLQLAKAAIAGGIDTILAQFGKEAAHIEHFYIAGGFGSFMDLQSACRIGLFPKDLQDKAKIVGNTATAGAGALLFCEREDAAHAIFARASYVELSSSPVFMESFVNQMFFPASN